MPGSARVSPTYTDASMPVGIGIKGLEVFSVLNIHIVKIQPIGAVTTGSFVAYCQYRGIYFVHDHFSTSLELSKNQWFFIDYLNGRTQSIQGL